MPAIRIGEDLELLQQPEPFSTEYELQEILAAHPALLAGEGDRPLATVCRELLLGTGFADLFLVDEEGFPAVVEVKLARNGESRREVIGQLCDYLSAIARLTPEEIDERSGGCLAALLPQLASRGDGEEEPEARLARIRSTLSAALRSGKVRGIVVLDEAPEELIREFSYLNEHSDLDLRLAVIERYRLKRREHFYHSRFLVRGSSDPEVRGSRLRFRLILEKFAKLKAPGFSLRRTGPENARVLRDGWPPGLHYEFSDWKDAVAIEVQAKNDTLPAAAAFLSRLREHLDGKVPHAREADLVPDHFGWTRLRFFFDESVDPYWIARNMERLIAVTEKDLTLVLEER
jgi:hypothetical protein